MTDKPTHEELELRVKELERVADEYMRKEKAFQVPDQEKEAILNSLLEHVVHQDTKMNILWANRAACESVNLTHEELLGRSCYEIWQQRSDPCPDCPVKKAIETCQPQEIEKTTPDGRCWFIRGYPLRDSNGNIKGGIEVTLEVTEHKRAEDALQKSEEKYREFVEGTDDFIAQVDSEGRLTYINDKAEKVFGLSKEKCIGLYAFDFIHPDDREKTKVAFGKWIRDRISNTTFENRQVNQTTGEVYHMHWTINFHYDEAGNITGINSIARDITERKLAEETLQESEERLISFMNSASDSMYLLDSNLNFVEVNKRGLGIIGKKREEVVGKNITDVVPYIKESGRYKQHLEVIKTGKPFEIDDFIPHPIFGDLNFILKSFKVGDGLGVIASDITERRQADEALLESERRYRTLFNNTPVGIGVATIQGRALAANDALLQMTGYQEADLDQISLTELYQNPEDRDLVMKQLKTDGFIHGFEIQFLRKDGTPFYGSITVTPFPMENEGTHLMVMVDVTQRKQAEDALRESEEKYSSLFHFSNDGIFLHDLEGNIIDVNQKALDQLGYTKSEMLSFKIPDFHPPEALEKSQWAFETIVREGFVSFETDFKKKTGEVFPAEVSSSLFEIGDKKVIQGIVRDITERKQAEEEREKLINELQKAIKEIKTLRGILPLCSYCKKIRDDKGYWEQVDVYIHKHLQADISHSLCPDCAKENYPDLDIHE